MALRDINKNAFEDDFLIHTEVGGWDVNVNLHKGRYQATVCLYTDIDSSDQCVVVGVAQAPSITIIRMEIMSLIDNAGMTASEARERAKVYGRETDFGVLPILKLH